MISVMTVCYNRPMMLARLLDSLEEQEDFEWLLFDDNSKPEIEMLAREFLKTHPGQYVKSDIKDEDRPQSVRYSVGINTLLPLCRGDIFTHFGDDSEATPGLFRQVLDGFQEKAVYVGIAYRWTDLDTGKVEDWMERDYPGYYGEHLNRAGGILDASQLYYVKDCAVRWAEHPTYWFRADAMAIDHILEKTGGAVPLGNPRKDFWVYNNLNRASITRLQSPEAVIEAVR